MALDTLPLPDQEKLSPDETRLEAQKRVVDVIKTENNSAITAVAAALEKDEKLAELDANVQNTAVETLTKAGKKNGSTTVTALGKNTLGQNTVGAHEEKVNIDLVEQAALTGDAELTGITVEHELVHSFHDPNAQDLIGKNGEEVKVFHQFEGDAQETSDPGAVVNAPDNYNEARKIFKQNDPSVLRANARGVISHEAAQTKLFKQSNLTKEQQESALESSNIKRDVAKRILRNVHGVRSQFENGPESDNKPMKLAA